MTAREVVGVDLPGHGATPPLSGPLTVDRLVEAVFASSVRASFALVEVLRPALPVLAGSAVGRTALLPQSSPRPWAVPADVALTDLQSIARTPALDETLRALVDSGPQLGGPTPGRVVLGWGRRDRVTLPRQAARRRPSRRRACTGSTGAATSRCGTDRRKPSRSSCEPPQDVHSHPPGPVIRRRIGVVLAA